MSMLEKLKELGVNVDEGVDRVMGDSSLYESLLWMFTNSVREAAITPEDFNAENPERIIKKAHMLKGETGNLGLTPLFEGYTNTLGFLRKGQIEQAREEYERFMPIQAQILNCIKGSGV